MSDLEKRYNAHISTAPGVAGVSVYCETLAELREVESHYAKQGMEIQFVNEGYADETYHDGMGRDGGPTIAGTEYVRRTTRSVPRAEWVGVHVGITDPPHRLRVFPGTAEGYEEAVEFVSTLEGVQDGIYYIDADESLIS